ncbi:MAG: hypothetical protein FD133_1689 [Erysipelotrichaceae bacterium]|nr:MAG: hypothetical protein FD133_1689 [Erysipelotrichaceae bacterium]
MNQFKKNLKKNAFDEDVMYNSILQRASKDGLRSAWAKAPKESTMLKRGLIFISMTFILIFSLFIFNPLGLFGKDQSKVVAAVISVDINPSFELSVNNGGLVIKIEALNDDAKSLDTDDLLGEPVEEVVDAIVSLATEAGFIDITDLEDDYVLVSTVLIKGTANQVGDMIQQRIRDRIHLSDPLQNVNLVQIKATLQEQMQARSKDVPVGLYVINGMIQTPNGQYISVKEFFSNSENKEAIKNRAQFNEIPEAKIRERISAALTELDEAGVDTTQLRTRLENASKETMIQIQSEVKKQINKKDGSGNDDAPGPQPDPNYDNQNQPNTDSGSETSGQNNDEVPGPQPDPNYDNQNQPNTDSGSETSGPNTNSGSGGSGSGGH